MIAVLVAALTAGFLGGAHCAGMCGGFAAAVGANGGWTGTALYSLGRTISYAGLGALAGSVGLALGNWTYAGAIVSGALLIVFSLRLAGLLPASKRLLKLTAPVMKLARASRGTSRVLFGMANGLLPCGLVYAALALPVTAGDPVAGALTMAVFGIGTLPVMGTLGVLSGRFRPTSLGLRRAMAAAVFLAGVFAITQRAPTDDLAEGEAPCCSHGDE